MDSTDFIVYLEHIPPEGLERNIEITDLESAELELAVPLAQPLRARITLTRLADKVMVRGRISLSVGLECSRCLRSFSFPVDNGVETYLQVGTGGEVDEDRKLTAEEMEVRPLEKNAVDVREIIAEQVHLALPVKPLCSEDCRGLCSRCGIDLNSESCSCRGDQNDPRWEDLKKIKVK